MALDFGAVAIFHDLSRSIHAHHLATTRPAAAVSRVIIIGCKYALGDLLFVLQHSLLAVDLARHGGDIAVHFGELLGLFGALFAALADLIVKSSELDDDGLALLAQFGDVHCHGFFLLKKYFRAAFGARELFA